MPRRIESETRHRRDCACHRQRTPTGHRGGDGVSVAALDVARRNSRRLGFRNVEFREGWWYKPLADEPFDVIVSNLPHVAEGDPHLGEGDVRFEPRRALSAGKDSLDDVCMIAVCARSRLVKNGWLLVEHGFDQGKAVTELLSSADFREVGTRRDYAGNPRVSSGQNSL